MTDQLRLEDVVNAYRDTGEVEAFIGALAPVLPVWRLLAEGRPVSPERVAAAVGRPVGQVREDLRRVEETGFYGTDESGDIVNFFGLQLEPRNIRLDMGGRTLYAG